jgi:hypothetical protein
VVGAAAAAPSPVDVIPLRDIPCRELVQESFEVADALGARRRLGVFYEHCA